MKIEHLDMDREVMRTAIELAEITSKSAGMEAYRATHDGESVIILFAPGFSRAVANSQYGYQRLYDVKTIRAAIRKLIEG